MKFLFIVQGEGRGHMTQTISMQDMLIRNGHVVAEVLVGKSEQREIPKFFFEKVKCPIFTYESPNFILKSNHKGVRVFKTISFNFWRARRFFRSMALINKHIRDVNPDRVINFYEPLAGMTYLIYRPKVPYVAVGHQFLLYHPEFVFPRGQYMQKFLLHFNSMVTSIGAKKRIALSFKFMVDKPKMKLIVVPPLLRKEVLELTPGNGNYILGYMLNPGYGEEIIRWHQSNPKVIGHFFWDKREAPEDLEVEPNLFFHRISDVKFLSYMKDCAGYASTSGFESVCEAMYLRKPILMVPTQGHFEQECNSVDAKLAGAGIVSDHFDLDKLIEFIPAFDKNDDRFVRWVREGEKKFMKILTQ